MIVLSTRVFLMSHHIHLVVGNIRGINLSIDDVRKVVKLQSIQTAARHATNTTKRAKNDITSTPNA